MLIDEDEAAGVPVATVAVEEQGRRCAQVYAPDVVHPYFAVVLQDRQCLADADPADPVQLRQLDLRGQRIPRRPLTRLELLLEQLPASGHRAVSPEIRYFDRPGESWFAGGVVDRGWPRHLQPVELAGLEQSLRPSECLSGCCIVARRETWERVGFFDPGYFLIFEDSDWSMRAVRHGVALYVVTASTIRHRVSSSFGRGPASPLGGYYFVRNGLRFEARYFARYLPRFVVQWLVRPVPALLRSGRGRELAFRWFGALAFAAGLRGRAPRVLERLAARCAV